VTNSYNHYGLLRTIEDIFGLSHLGFAAQDGLPVFGGEIFNASGEAQRASSPDSGQ
jgi:phosphatidylinositol-3-phosphatase